MDSLTKFEREVLTKLLEGQLEELATLRGQLARTHVIKREFTGAGFYADLYVPDDVARLPKRERIVLGGVHIAVPENPAGLGAIVFVKDGALEMLEGFTYEGAWPERMSMWQVSELSAERELQKLTTKLRP